VLDYFDRVFGVDVSADQIALAERVLGEKRERADLRRVDEPFLDVADSSCSGMVSTHVFQHLSRYSGIEAYLRETYRALIPGASICFQIPVPGADKGDIPPLWLRASIEARTMVARAIGRRRFMEYNRYPVNRITTSLSDAGFDDVELRIIRLATTGFRQSFFFARKPRAV
jgi:SAM-dependent methyltransferase